MTTYVAKLDASSSAMGGNGGSADQGGAQQLGATRLTLVPTAAAAARPNCLATSTHEPHYGLTARLLHEIRRFATDAIPTIVAFSDDLETSLPRFCSLFAPSCSGRHREFVDLHRLLLADIAATGDGSEAAVSRARAVAEQLQAGTNATRHNARLFLEAGHMFFFASLKKILLVAYTNCERVWLVDTESVPFRPFAFRESALTLRFVRACALVGCLRHLRRSRLVRIAWRASQSSMATGRRRGVHPCTICHYISTR
jgi:hypothetical protein